MWGIHECQTNMCIYMTPIRIAPFLARDTTKVLKVWMWFHIGLGICKAHRMKQKCPPHWKHKNKHVPKWWWGGGGPDELERKDDGPIWSFSYNRQKATSSSNDSHSHRTFFGQRHHQGAESLNVISHRSGHLQSPQDETEMPTTLKAQK